MERIRARKVCVTDFFLKENELINISKSDIFKFFIFHKVLVCIYIIGGAYKLIQSMHA